MGASAVVLLAFNRVAADATGLSSSAVDPGLASVVPIHAFKIAEIAEGRATGTDARAQDVNQGLTQARQLHMRQGSRC